MKCPICGEEHPDDAKICTSTGEQLKKMCLNQCCSYYKERIFDLGKDICPCCGGLLFTTTHEYVDLGLSVKWATCNIGANTPEEYGDYFAWGETFSKNNYIWSNLKYCNDKDGESFSKYNQSDNITVLELNDDAARANWGGSWRMPTDAEWQELIEYCIWEWTTLNGVEGYKVTSKIPGYTSNSIFLPAAGYKCYYDDYCSHAGLTGKYWSSSLFTDFPFDAFSMAFDSDEIFSYDSDSRYIGRTVRPVLE